MSVLHSSGHQGERGMFCLFVSPASPILLSCLWACISKQSFGENCKPLCRSFLLLGPLCLPESQSQGSSFGSTTSKYQFLQPSIDQDTICHSSVLCIPNHSAQKFKLVAVPLLPDRVFAFFLKTFMVAPFEIWKKKQTHHAKTEVLRTHKSLNFISSVPQAMTVQDSPAQVCMAFSRQPGLGFQGWAVGALCQH